MFLYFPGQFLLFRGKGKKEFTYGDTLCYNETATDRYTNGAGNPSNGIFKEKEHLSAGSCFFMSAELFYQLCPSENVGFLWAGGIKMPRIAAVFCFAIGCVLLAVRLTGQKIKS